MKPFAIYHEHPDWFRPLFAELERRGIPFVRLDATRHFFDPADTREGETYGLVFNRMSPSAYLRGGGNSTFYTQSLLAHWERQGLRVINGSHAYTVETSKALQLSLLEALGLDYPKAKVINHPALAPVAAEGLRFPVVVKANIGGSGAGIVRYDTPEELKAAVAAGTIDLGLDSTALVQEFTPARDGHITRVETLGGKYLYAIDVYTNGDSFNLCPADVCQTRGGVELARSACAVDAPKTGISVEATTPSQEVIAAIERIVQAAKIDVGGIEFMVDDRDGRLVYYDVNALSNFVADARNVIGFDPHERLVDFLIAEARE
jgi:hypothetical protein